MNTENQYDSILREAYIDYVSNFLGYDDVPNISWFEKNAMSEPEFMDRWGIKIEMERIILSERISIASKYKNFNPMDFGIGDESHEFAQKVCDDYGVPKIIYRIYYKENKAIKYE